ncbi:tetratricopeptide repeat protein [Nannocystis bainbridge]|uniref:Tetratricopeptide repeat protein n=1 Tax=Nannocystis bainbridge TaxID=2995303 RepID=A0ABT5E424_9BACT|nr:tetratricopeptide repeat protein [Nannocystis bainbridge]MDC0720629.1 tetratricopeptide repeat protein [Nannocystis bainbridge]
MSRTLDAVLKRDELQRLLGSGDAARLYEAARNAAVALEFRGTDAMLGLEPVRGEVLAELEAAIHAALVEAAGLGLHAAARERARLLLQAGELAGAFAAVEAAAQAGDAPAAALAARVAWRAADPARGARALAWLHAARERDDDGQVHYMLGVYACLDLGGAGRDFARGREFHEQAAACGHADSMFELYVIHTSGAGCPEDQVAAVAWCRRAAEAGNVRAMGNLGGFYATGSGVERDPARALEWYERAAQAGHGRSAATLGVMYATGDCVPRSPSQAQAWLRAAEALGFDWRDMAEAVDLDPDAWEADAEPPAGEAE